MARDLLIGISGGGVLHTDAHVPDTDTIFRMVKEAGVFDYVERSPPPLQLNEFRAAADRHGVPLLAGSYYYVLGRDEPLLEWHLRIGRNFGARAQNVQITVRDADGIRVTDERLAETYLRFAELGEKLGVTPCFEVHVNMWSERFTRVARVAELVEAKGAKFNITLDHSHVIFKIGNLHERHVEDNGADIDAGLLELDPAKPGNVCDLWIGRNWVRHAHARPAVPDNPVNLWARHPDGSFGRGIQYPFVQPAPGEYLAPWDGARLEPWKEVLRRLMRHHATDPASRLEQITVEMIPGIDYGAGHRYSIFDHSVAVAGWLRRTWNDIKPSRHAAPAPHNARGRP
jgi:hypothetical protein